MEEVQYSPFRKIILDPEEEKEYLQQLEEQKKKYLKFKQELEDYVAYIQKNPEALPDFSEMPEWIQKKGECSSIWIRLKGL